MKVLNKVFRFLGKYYGTLLGAGLFCILAAIVFILVYPFNVANIKSIDISNKVQSGGLVEYTVDYCQNVGAGVERHTRRFLVPTDDTKVNPIELSSNPSLETLQGSSGCKTSKTVKIPIDTSIPPGEYKILLQVQYCIFPGRCITVEGNSKPFQVTKPDILGQLRNINQQLESINEYYQNDPKAISDTGNTNAVGNVVQTFQLPPDPNGGTPQTQPNTTVNTSTNTTNVTNNDQPSILESALNAVNGLINGIKR